MSKEQIIIKGGITIKEGLALGILKKCEKHGGIYYPTCLLCEIKALDAGRRE